MACNLYSISLSPFSVYQYNILDCSGNTQTLIVTNPTSNITNSRFCANEVLEFTGDTPSVTSGACQSNCTCFTINLLTNKSNLNYVDCNNNYVIGGGTNDVLFENAQPGQFFDFCALYSEANPNAWSTVNNGDCETGCTFCRCITVHNPDKDNFTFNYTDCNGVTGTTNLVSGQTVTFCGLDTDIVPGGEVTVAVNYGNKCVDDPGGDYPFKCPCKCTTVSNIGSAVNFNVNLLYVDCNGVTNFLEPQPVTTGSFSDGYSICTQNVVSVIPGVRAQPSQWAAVYGADCVDNSCPCYCYNIPNEGPEFLLKYIDCGSISATTHSIPTNSVTTFCSPSIITQTDITVITNQAILYTGGTCSSGSCVCNCYSLTNTTESLIKQNYIDCSFVKTDISIPAGGIVKICSIGFDSLNSGLDVVSEGPCVNGYCPGDCGCYYVISTNGFVDIDVTIIDCNDDTVVLTGLVEGSSFCAKSYISSNVIGSLIGESDGLCTGGICPQNVNCYNIDAGPSAAVYTYFINSEGIVEKIEQTGPVSFCAIAVLTEYDSNGNPVGNELGTITNTGDCINSEYYGYTCPKPCYCFYSFNATFVEYVNCDYEFVTLVLNPGFNKICGQQIINSDVLFFNSNLLCDNNRCPNYCCNCYTILPEVDGDITYLNCDLQLSEISVISGESVQICALNVPFGRYSVTLNGPCYNEQCVDTMSIQDQLLYDILTTYGPCPDICCGENEAFGGPMGIDVTDIKSGKVL